LTINIDQIKKLLATNNIEVEVIMIVKQIQIATIVSFLTNVI